MGDNNKIFEVTITLKTAIFAQDGPTAETMVAEILPLDIEFGLHGQILPFNLEDISSRQITDEDIGRG